MRVLHVVPDIAFGSGGPSSAAVNLCESLTGLGVEVSLVTTDYGVSTRTIPAAVDVHTAHCVFPRWRWSPTFWQVLKPLLDQVQVVHLHGVWLFPIWSAARLCRTLDIPYLLRPCGMLESWSVSQKSWKKSAYSALFERQTIRHAAAIHFTAESEKTKSHKFATGRPACIVPLAVQRESYDDLPELGVFRSRHPEVGQRRVVLFLGRVHYKKRPDLLIHAFRYVIQEFPEAVLVFAGPVETDYLSLLRSLIAELGLNGRVIFTGLLQGRAVQEALVDAEVFVLPSLQENFGLAVAEAMAAKCPVVVTPEVALAKEIEEYSAGIVVERSAEAISNAIGLLLRDEARRRAMGRNGRRLILDRFTGDRMAREMLGIYHDIVEGTRTSLAWTGG